MADALQRLIRTRAGRVRRRRVQRHGRLGRGSTERHTQRDLSPKAWPRYVWIAEDLPSTATNEILKRELIARGVDPVGRVLWKREATRFQPSPLRIGE